MTDSEYLELLTLSAVIIPNLSVRSYDVGEAERRQLELFEKAAKPYSLYQEVEEVTQE